MEKSASYLSVILTSESRSNLLTLSRAVFERLYSIQQAREMIIYAPQTPNDYPPHLKRLQGKSVSLSVTSLVESPYDGYQIAIVNLKHNFTSLSVPNILISYIEPQSLEHLYDTLNSPDNRVIQLPNPLKLHGMIQYSDDSTTITTSKSPLPPPLNPPINHPRLKSPNQKSPKTGITIYRDSHVRSQGSSRNTIYKLIDEYEEAPTSDNGSQEQSTPVQKCRASRELDMNDVRAIDPQTEPEIFDGPRGGRYYYKDNRKIYLKDGDGSRGIRGTSATRANTCQYKLILD